MYRVVISVLVLFVLLAGSISADVPTLINYQGVLTLPGSDTPVVNDTYSITFTIYDAAVGGEAKWFETQPVSTSNGAFVVLLGSVNPILDTVFAEPSRYLGITVSTDPEMQPRTMLLSVPWSYRTATIDGTTGGNIEGTIIITVDQFTNGDAIVILNNAGDTTMKTAVDYTGRTSVSFYDVVDSKIKANAPGDEKLRISKDGITLFGATDSDTLFNLSANGDIQSTGELQMGDQSAGSGVWSVVLGYNNLASGDTSVVSGGSNNTVSGIGAIIAGGSQNEVAGDYSFTVGYRDTITAAADYSVLFGIDSKLTQDSTFMIDMPYIRLGDELTGYELPTSDGISGQVLTSNGVGQVDWADPSGISNWTETGDVLFTNSPLGIARAGNTLYGQHDSTHVNLGVNSVTGGSLSAIKYATVSGGRENIASGTASTVGGGYANYARGSYSVIAGGGGAVAVDSNSATGEVATIGGGRANVASGVLTTVGGGFNNTATYMYATVAGGRDNSADSTHSTIGGGSGNSAGGYTATIAGGYQNTADGSRSTIGGGYQNYAALRFATVAGGASNVANADRATVAGGQFDSANGSYSFVGGGSYNTADTISAAVVGGAHNQANGILSFVGGGEYNIAGATQASISGGAYNEISATAATIGGGRSNKASGLWSTIGGGYFDTASGAFATVPGGRGNKASGNYSFAAGDSAKATHTGSWVWSSGAIQTNSWASNTFTARATGGVRFYSSVGTTIGVALPAGGGAWQSLSDRASKDNITEVDYDELLKKIDQLSISEWNYKSQDESIKHIGPMAQDFYELFGVGDDDKHLSTLDPDGVALAAIKSLSEKNRTLESQVEKLLKRVETLEAKTKK